MIRRALLSCAYFFFGLVLARSVWAEEAFVRVRRDENNRAVALETSIAHYVRAGNADSSFSVDLVSAVHVGEKSYYEELNKVFSAYDVVLYELIAEKGDMPRESDQPAHPISMIQLAIKDFLKLEFQLQGINYRAKNFVHADMSPEEFVRSMESRNESFLQMFVRAIMLAYSKELSGEGKPPDLSMLLLLVVKDRSVLLRRMMAEQFDDMDSVLEALNGPEGSTILSERNKVALAGLRKQKALGKKRCAIFYGGAHMPDMERRLVAEFGLVRQSAKWLTAWKLQ